MRLLTEGEQVLPATEYVYAVLCEAERQAAKQKTGTGASIPKMEFEG